MRTFGTPESNGDPLPLTLDLRLEERESDRVRVSVCLSPDGGPQNVDGVALQLCTREGVCLGPRLLIPIGGQVVGPLTTSAELRSRTAIPDDSQVVAVAWWGSEEVEVTCPSDRGTCLEFHMRGRKRVPLPDHAVLRRLTKGERATLTALMPWVAEPLVLPDPTEIEPVDTDETAEEMADEICAELGLDEDNARWLKELLTEED